MRTIAEGATEQGNVGFLKRGGDKESWQLMPGTLRCVNAGTGTCTITLFVSYTGEAADVVSVPASGAISGAAIDIPYEYSVVLDTIVGSVNVSVYLDGDTA